MSEQHLVQLSCHARAICHSREGGNTKQQMWTSASHGVQGEVNPAKHNKRFIAWMPDQVRHNELQVAHQKILYIFSIKLL
jgi:hypothetical protein